jgi:hypothetical protein
MIVPATSGLAMLDGLPPIDCDLTDQYGMTRYSRRTTPQKPGDTTPESLCAKAKTRGFSRVVIIAGSGGNDVDVGLAECRPVPS